MGWCPLSGTLCRQPLRPAVPRGACQEDSGSVDMMWPTQGMSCLPLAQHDRQGKEQPSRGSMHANAACSCCPAPALCPTHCYNGAVLVLRLARRQRGLACRLLCCQGRRRAQQKRQQEQRRRQPPGWQEEAAAAAHAAQGDACSPRLAGDRLRRPFQNFYEAWARQTSCTPWKHGGDVCCSCEPACLTTAFLEHL